MLIKSKVMMTVMLKKKYATLQQIRKVIFFLKIKNHTCMWTAKATLQRHQKKLENEDWPFTNTRG